MFDDVLDEKPPPPPSPWPRRLVLLLAGLTALIGFVLGFGMVLERIAESRDHDRFPPTGDIYPVSDRPMHITCRGPRPDYSAPRWAPTVLFEADIGQWSIAWHQVLDQVGRWAHACAYDRAGYGWSAARDGTRDSRAVVADLTRLLDAADVRPPFLLVGHGAASFPIRRYAAQYPYNVAGLVLIDPVGESTVALFERIERRRYDAVLPAPILARFGYFLFVDPAPLNAAGMPGRETALYRRWLTHHHSHRTIAAEFDALAANAAGSEGFKDFGDVPTVIVSAENPFRAPELIPDDLSLDGIKAAWGRAQGRQLAMADAPQHLVTVISGHGIPNQEPDVVAMAVKRALDLHDRRR